MTPPITAAWLDADLIEQRLDIRFPDASLHAQALDLGAV